MLIGQAAAMVGMTTKAVRFYEAQGLLPAAKRAANGYRQYSEEAVGRLDFIRRGRAAGLTVAQLKGILAVQEPGAPPCTHVRDVLASQLAALDAQIAELTNLRAAVAGSYDSVAAGDPKECNPQDICTFL